MMYGLTQKEVLIIDCQTTAMHPNQGFIVQIGWGVYKPYELHAPCIEKWTLKLPEEAVIPTKIRDMLELSESELSQSVAPHIAFAALQCVLKTLGPEPIVIAHYAQFERGFLKQFYHQHTGFDELNFNLICTQKIAKRLLPQVPSHNLKALAGYYQLPSSKKNEVISHVTMTLSVWRELVAKLMDQNISCYQTLLTWINQKEKKASSKPYEYNIEQVKRLSLPELPGVYRMLAQDGSVLYIGKATSLKDRVNSYFRGIKKRDRRKLEMLAQVWDIETVVCDTPLEAALLESDEIKRCSPPYNILLQAKNRALIFYNDEFSDMRDTRDAQFFIGPFKPFDSVMSLLELIKALKTGALMNYDNQDITPELMKSAWTLFCTTYSLDNTPITKMNFRGFAALGYKLLKGFEKKYGVRTFEKWWSQEKAGFEEGLSIEQKMALKISRSLIRAAICLRQSRQIRALYNSSLIIKATQKKIFVVHGELLDEVHHADSNENSLRAMTINHYDRLSLLVSAKNKKLLASLS